MLCLLKVQKCFAVLMLLLYFLFLFLFPNAAVKWKSFLFSSTLQISSGEYIQMSGRAGRRGMDERGIVIFMVDEKMSPAVGKQLLKVTLQIKHDDWFRFWVNCSFKQFSTRFVQVTANTLMQKLSDPKPLIPPPLSFGTLCKGPSHSLIHSLTWST